MDRIEQLEQRVAAIERTVVDGEHTIDELDDLETLLRAVDKLTSDVEAMEQRLLKLESGLEALEGCVGNIQSVNESVEQQAGVAIVSAKRAEHRVDTISEVIDVETIQALEQQVEEFGTELDDLRQRLLETETDEDEFGDLLFGERSEPDEGGTTIENSGSDKTSNANSVSPADDAERTTASELFKRLNVSTGVGGGPTTAETESQPADAD